MATIEDELEEKSQCENTAEAFSPEFVTELSNKLEHLSPGDECVTNIDMFDDRLNEMTASYSEISFDSQTPPDLVSDFEASLVSPADFLEQGMDLQVSERSRRFEDPFPDSDNKRPDRLDLHEMESVDKRNRPFHQAFQDLNLEGTVTKDGDMVLFVTGDLETKIKLSSPVMKKGDTPSFPGSRTSTPCLYRQALTPQLPPIDPGVLNDLEAEVKKVATSVDTLTENLAGILRSVSALTVDCLEIYRDAVCKTCDAVDSNIKSMYQLMAKCEELSKSMAPIYKLSELIKGIKRLLDLFENAVNV
ncbi:BLOC-1-related complex subunit 6 [Bacillus rossius redtenbacheri]|uniref:BLOC-1-related complex subunit 6 n=1 Tax=Bacillus rossius redtenbacheri TaxID=93214 RepID=UPI002FDCD555